MLPGTSTTFESQEIDSFREKFLFTLGRGLKVPEKVWPPQGSQRRATGRDDGDVIPKFVPRKLLNTLEN